MTSSNINRTILVVDDDKKIVQLVSLYLKREGYRVLTAFDGQEALELARSKQPDLIVLDLFPVSYTHLRAHETVLDLVCRLLLEKKNM